MLESYTLKPSNNDLNPTTVYRKVGIAKAAGMRKRQGVKDVVIYADPDGQLYFRSPADFENRMVLKCAHETRLGHMGTGRISCADCKEMLS